MDKSQYGQNDTWTSKLMDFKMKAHEIESLNNVSISVRLIQLKLIIRRLIPVGEFMS